MINFNFLLGMFSWQHFVWVGIVLAIIVAMFFLRKYFIKYKYLDLGFRIFLVVLMWSFETFARFAHEPKNGFWFQSVFLNVLPPPLCGHILWLTIIMLLSNSSRLHKLIYPLAVTGASMSLIFLDCSWEFPDPGLFQFFIIHGGFLLAVLYFFFTKKTLKYTFHDLMNSMLLLGGMGAVMMLISYLHPEIGDPYYQITPPQDIIAFKEALGQIGYTLFYIFAIMLIQFIIYGITWLCTRKRKEEEIIYPEFKENKILNKLASIEPNTRKKLMFLMIIVFTYLVGIQAFTENRVFMWICFALYDLGILACVLFEVVNNYSNWQLRNTPMLIDNLEEAK